MPKASMASAAAFVMHAIAGQIRGAGDMEPMQAASHAQTAFIDIDHRSLDQCAGDG